MIVPSVTPLLRQLPCCHPRNDHRASRCASVTPLLWRLPCCHARNDHFGRRRPQPDPRKQEPAIRACRRDGPAPGLEPTPRWQADPHPRRPRRPGAEAAQQHAPNSDQRTGGPPPRAYPRATSVAARDLQPPRAAWRAQILTPRADPQNARRCARPASATPRLADPHRLLSPTDTAHPRATPVTARDFRPPCATPSAARDFGRRAQLSAPRATSARRAQLRAPRATFGAARDLQPPRAAWRAQILTPRCRSASPAHPQRPRSPPPTTPTRGTTSRRNGVSTYEEEVP